MSVLIEAISVVIRADALLRKLPGGWDSFILVVPNKTLCADNEIVRVGFMTPQDVESFINKLQLLGLEFLREGEAIDIAVVDQLRGLTSKCTWLEFGHVEIGGAKQKVSVCRLSGSRVSDVITPVGWDYDGSLSSTFAFVPSEHATKGMKFLRHENGLDIYFNPITGKEMYVGRSGV